MGELEGLQSSGKGLGMDGSDEARGSSSFNFLQREGTQRSRGEHAGGHIVFCVRHMSHAKVT